MPKNLVIVESPAKAKTIEKFLGEGFTVKSSFGHIRDLKKKGMSVDIEKDFEPSYEVPADKKELVNELKKLSKSADVVWLASDEDREGEAIAWHLAQVLKLDESSTKRIVFHEITKSAILHAIENPRTINDSLVSAQQARRVLDRIVGFELSPILWKKVRPNLSAGRVQSVTVRLIVDREREINAFQSESSYKVQAVFEVPDEKGRMVPLKAELSHRLKDQAEAMAFLERCKTAKFSVADIVVKPTKRSPAPPFTTSTLQQEASRKLGFSVAQTMNVAQRLYEAGLITYMRTDSVNLSELALSTAAQEIEAMAGKQYAHRRTYHTSSKGAQEAHEAIRPTYISNHKIEGTPPERRLYDLIWKRTIASQMADAQLEKTVATIDVSGEQYKFTAEGEVMKFDGFLKVYMESRDDEEEKSSEGLLPPIKTGDVLDKVSQIMATERFTQRPARYSEASLVHKLEELGIGRPSTYASTISTIQNRGYVEKGDRPGVERIYSKLTLVGSNIKAEQCREEAGADKGKLFPTDTALVVNDFLADNFPNILDYNFTANVEKEFDDIAEGNARWQDVIRSFYGDFHDVVEKTNDSGERMNGERYLGDDPKSGKPVYAKIARFGAVAQIGTTQGDEKPRFASLHSDQHIETITLEEALSLFALPRTLGEQDGKEIVVSTGRFGPYVKCEGKFYSLPKTVDPLEITLEQALDIVAQKLEEEKKKHIKVMTVEGKTVEILNGRYGPYFTCDGENYRLPKTVDPMALTESECLALMQKQSKEKENKPKRTTRTRSAARKK